ncbi:MerR family transcriptional regulator [Streptomyces sp. NPDC001508]|uniref:MerR family transcriptional regulator n=1 Tax=Streptomyces sp. NPDC001508 TaxID=3154656 RepID=UPI003330E17C
MRVGALASRAGASVRSLRYYEEQGLPSSTRSTSGRRHCTDDEIERALFIQRPCAAGLSSRTIAEPLPCVDAPSEEASDRAGADGPETRPALRAATTWSVRVRCWTG